MKVKPTEKVRVKRFINTQLQSNSYVIFSENETSAWIIDPGDTVPLLGFLNEKDLILKGVIVTHTHFDHIYGLNELRHQYKDLLIYASEDSKELFVSTRLNGSLYAEIPFVVDLNGITFLKNGDVFPLWNNANMKAYETPGHNVDCMSYYIDCYLFSGDSFIPGIKVHLKSKNANKELALETIKWIKGFFSENTMICPGHLNECILKDANIIF